MCSPRNTYQSAQVKQAMCLYATNHQKRFDTTAYILNYPQRPIVSTRTMALAGLDELPNGEMAIVAIMSGGWNQEDSIIMNQSSIDRGLFRSTMYKTYKEEEKRLASSAEELIHVPPAGTKHRKYGDYNLLELDGLAAPGTRVKAHDVIIGKTSPAGGGSAERRDASTVIKTTEDGTVDAVMITENEGGRRSVKMRIRTEVNCTAGDKFASRSGAFYIRACFIHPSFTHHLI